MAPTSKQSWGPLFGSEPAEHPEYSHKRKLAGRAAGILVFRSYPLCHTEDASRVFTEDLQATAEGRM